MDTVRIFTPKDWANVRQQPNTRAAIIGTVVDGQIVTQSGAVKNGWTELVDPAGWVFPGVDFVDLPQRQPGDVTCDGLQPPVGTAAEWATGTVWPGEWIDASPYGQRNFNGLHTGADLNLNLKNKWDADKGMPLYAVADGVVKTVARFPKWGWLIVIRHDPLPDGVVFWSRYAHMQTIETVQTARVKRGHILGTIGNAGWLAYHLHFDIGVSDVLKEHPAHWPKFDAEELEKHYVDPKAFIERYHYMRLAGG